MVNIQYSVLCHYPSLIGKDCISLGVLFYDRTEKKSVFDITKRWDRVKTFTDELDIDLVKMQMKDIENEVNEYGKGNGFNLFEYTKFYVNELKFTEVVDVEVEDFQEFIIECRRQYLRFDVSKRERPNVEQQVNFIKNIMKKSNIGYKIDAVTGIFGENIPVDFTIGDYAFKLFRFEGRQENRLIRAIKDWAYDALKLKDKYKFVFVTDVDFNQSKQYQVLYKILREECSELINFDELMPFIQKLDNKQIVNL